MISSPQITISTSEPFNINPYDFKAVAATTAIVYIKFSGILTSGKLK